VDLMVDAPTPVSNQQLRHLSIEVKAKKEGAGE
jgi:aspartyl-tRNA synthetase